MMRMVVGEERWGACGGAGALSEETRDTRQSE